MAQFYTLEEAARVLGMSPDDLKHKAQVREVRAFMDSGSWQFRVADVDELARHRGLGSDPDLSLSDLDLDIPAGSGSGSDEFDLSEFQLGTDQADLGAQTSANLAASNDDDDEADVQFDDLTLPAGPLSNSSSTIIGMKSKGKEPSDSDVRLVPDQPLKNASDSDVRLMPLDPLSPSDAEVTLVSDDEGSLPDFNSLADKPPAARGGVSGVGSSAEINAAEGDSGSDFELTPSSDIAAALQPESGSDFELTALDASDEFEATPLAGPSDSDVTAALPSASGINLARPSDSGINLQGVGGFDLSDDSIELAPLDDDDQPAAPKPKAVVPPPPAAKAKPAAPSAAKVVPDDPGATSLGMTEKDIFEDTDFSLEVDALDGDRDDRTVQLERASDFDLDESDSASEVFALDEDDVDQNAATAMGAAVALPDEDDDDDFASSSGGGGGGGAASGWDVESEVGTSTGTGTAVSGSRMMAAGPQAEWGGIWVGLLGFTTALVLTGMVFSIDLIRNLYEFQGERARLGSDQDVGWILRLIDRA